MPAALSRPQRAAKRFTRRWGKIFLGAALRGEDISAYVPALLRLVRQRVRESLSRALVLHFLRRGDVQEIHKLAELEPAFGFGPPPGGFLSLAAGAVVDFADASGVEIAAADPLLAGWPIASGWALCRYLERHPERPVWLRLRTDGQCVPYSHVGILPGTNPQVVWVFIARRYKIRTDPAEKLFEDVAVIGHHRLAGDTAFFKMLDSSGKDGRRVPSPWEPADVTPPGQLTADDFWLSPAGTAGINCNQCHDSDPLSTRQVTVTTPVGTRTLVPPIRRGPYRFVGSQLFTAWPAPQHFKPQNNACVRCHRMGTQRSSDMFLRWSTGTSRGWTTSSHDQYPPVLLDASARGGDPQRGRLGGQVPAGHPTAGVLLRRPDAASLSRLGYALTRQRQACRAGPLARSRTSQGTPRAGRHDQPQSSRRTPPAPITA